MLAVLAALVVVAGLGDVAGLAPVLAGAASAPPRAPLLGPGAEGPAVVALQHRLAGLGYWLGPSDGVFGEATEQAVFALQKAAGIGVDGIVGPRTRQALARGVVPRARPVTGRAIEVDLSRQLVFVLDARRLVAVLNTSTGGGYRYRSEGTSALAVTPTGRFRVFRQVDALDVAPLGDLWRPKYFDGGIALHGAVSVPPVPVSHGCVRVSIAAMNWIWATHLAPVGTVVEVYRS